MTARTAVLCNTFLAVIVLSTVSLFLGVLWHMVMIKMNCFGGADREVNTHLVLHTGLYVNVFSFLQFCFSDEIVVSVMFGNFKSE